MNKINLMPFVPEWQGHTITVQAVTHKRLFNGTWYKPWTWLVRTSRFSFRINYVWQVEYHFTSCTVGHFVDALLTHNEGLNDVEGTR